MNRIMWCFFFVPFLFIYLRFLPNVFLAKLQKRNEQEGRTHRFFLPKSKLHCLFVTCAGHFRIITYFLWTVFFPELLPHEVQKCPPEDLKRGIKGGKGKMQQNARKRAVIATIACQIWGKGSISFARYKPKYFLSLYTELTIW